MDRRIPFTRTIRHSSTENSSENELFAESKEIQLEALNEGPANIPIKLEDIKERMMDYHVSFIKKSDSSVPHDIKTESQTEDDVWNDHVDKRFSSSNRGHDCAGDEKIEATSKADGSLQNANAIPIAKSDLLKFVELVKEKKYLLDKSNNSDPELRRRQDSDWKQIFQKMCWTVDMRKDQLEILKEEMRRRIFDSNDVEKSIPGTVTKTEDACPLFMDNSETTNVTTKPILQPKPQPRIINSQISFESDSESEDNLLIDESGNIKVSSPSNNLSYDEAENETSNSIDVGNHDRPKIETTEAIIQRQSEAVLKLNEIKKANSKTAHRSDLNDTDSDIEIVSIVQPNPPRSQNRSLLKKNAASNVRIENSSKSSTSRKTAPTQSSSQDRVTGQTTKKMMSAESAKSYSRNKRSDQTSQNNSNARPSASKRKEAISASSGEDSSDSNSSWTETNKRKKTKVTTKVTDIIDELFGKDVQKKLYGKVPSHKRTVSVADLVKQNKLEKTFGEPDLSDEASFYNFYKSLFTEYYSLTEDDKCKFIKMADSLMDCFCQEQIDDNLKKTRKE